MIDASLWQTAIELPGRYSASHHPARQTTELRLDSGRTQTPGRIERRTRNPGRPEQTVLNNELILQPSLPATLFPPMPRLKPEIAMTIATLSRGCEGIEAVMNTNHEENRFSLALQDLQRLAVDQDIPIAIIGGLGAIRYGYLAATQDIDIAVQKDQLAGLLLAAPRYGFKIARESKTGWHTLTHGDVEINVVPEGGRARDSSPTAIPGPQQMGVESGLNYASIECWVELKISSGRQKDRAHVVEVLKKTDEPTIEKIHDHLAHVHNQYELTFRQLLSEAIQERQQEKERR